MPKQKKNRTQRDFFNNLAFFNFEKQEGTHQGNQGCLMETWERYGNTETMALVIPQNPSPASANRYDRRVRAALGKTYAEGTNKLIGHPDASHLRITA